MMDTVVGPLFDPDTESLICTWLMGLSLFFALFIVFLVFLTVRIDAIVTWAWSVVWIPVWIMHGMLLMFHPLRQPMRLVHFFLLLVFQIFIVMRLDQQVMWPIRLVCIPYFVFEAVVCLASLGQIVRDPSKRIPILMFSRLWMPCMRCCTVLLISLRADRIITCSWAVVFLPTYLMGLKWAIELVIRYYQFSRQQQQQQQMMTLVLGAVIWVVMGLLCYTLIGLIAKRLDGTLSISMSTVFIPLFIVFSFCLCCSGCCLPCLLMISSYSNLDEGSFPGQLITKRITASEELGYA
ncbi:hypothetical protein A0J61_07980 [Choanephora cucurbitarum]|uniref:Transmembrane protein 185B n=1 Tax=Choanephora cucurbitarum TaxID=101091 RepID=A0A1C7N4I9_9FUNG|nr:hypothetical protein A0J61_07980 [Choanephora cucurbitarum]